MRRYMTGPEDGLAHSDMRCEIAVALGELDRSSYGSQRRDDHEDQVGGARSVVFLHAHNLAARIDPRQWKSDVKVDRTTARKPFVTIALTHVRAFSACTFRLRLLG